MGLVHYIYSTKEVKNESNPSHPIVSRVPQGKFEKKIR
jgi:hypothetical protein